VDKLAVGILLWQAATAERTSKLLEICFSANLMVTTKVTM
jgi:hypothetical protein